MSRECMQPCTKRTLVVRFEDSTAPYRAGNQRSNCVIPAPAGMQSISETGPNSAQTDAREPPECPGNACNHARNVHSWCVSKTPRHPTGQATSDRTASSPRMQESSRCPKQAPIQRQRMHGRPWNVPGMHATMHETHTRGAFRRLHGTLLGRQPAIELRHSRACGDPVDVRNRPQFSVNGCTGAPGMPRYCMQPCTKRALAGNLGLDDSTPAAQFTLPLQCTCASTRLRMHIGGTDNQRDGFRSSCLAIRSCSMPIRVAAMRLLTNVQELVIADV